MCFAFNLVRPIAFTRGGGPGAAAAGAVSPAEGASSSSCYSSSPYSSSAALPPPRRRFPTTAGCGGPSREMLLGELCHSLLDQGSAGSEEARWLRNDAKATQCTSTQPRPARERWRKSVFHAHRRLYHSPSSARTAALITSRITLMTKPSPTAATIWPELATASYAAMTRCG